MLLDEADKAIAVCLALELEIKSLFLLDDANSLVVGIMSQNELLQVKHGSLMGNFLSDLNLGSPCVRSIRHLAIIALLVGYCELDNESLL